MIVLSGAAFDLVEQAVPLNSAFGRTKLQRAMHAEKM
jgi:hypothetical protein